MGGNICRLQAKYTKIILVKLGYVVVHVKYRWQH